MAVLILAFGRRGRRFQRHSGKHVTGLHLKRGPGKFSEVKGYLPPVRTLCPVLLTLRRNTSVHQGCEMGLEPDNEPQRSLMIHPPTNRFTTSSFTSRATPIAGHMFGPAIKGFLQAGVYLTGACGTPAVSLSAALIPRYFLGWPVEGHFELQKSQCEQGRLQDLFICCLFFSRAAK